MFELLFKYPPAIFSKGKLALLSPWPVWLMFALLIVVGAALFWNMRQRQVALSSVRSSVIWLMQTALIAILLFMIWHPAIQRGAPAAAAKCSGRTCRSFPQHGNHGIRKNPAHQRRRPA